ncbi:hypothetical protein [Neopusillimonas aromaticivorans]|uniref:hypothetical protein n=1 Tax=Neopusillimonas aromaticivorans TaxID=2979868 RepID=UPI00259AD704|nr:hypothetical protein [Neopusillimonas aromaticivorans]WJJ93290.1 hypothetical protein N7E01_15000 [Neopusillimonas aromaticivorans]
MFFKLTGTALQAAQISIARYCLQLEGQSGAIDIVHVVKNINDEYRLVPEKALDALINDISYAYAYLKNQQLEEMSRAGYWKFKALSPFEAKQQLDDELGALGA